MDSWGRQFLDTVNNVAHVGHEHPRVVAAGQAQMAVLNTNTRYLHKKIIDYADELRNTLPKKLEVMYFVNSGSEANELALRMVRAATGSPHMLAIEMGYHGNTNAVIDVSSYKFDRKGGGGAPGHTHLLPVPDAFRGKHREDDVAEAYSAYSREQIAALERQGHTLGGLIHESILSCAGQIDPPEGYLQQVYEEVRNAGGICVADEVQTGFGRVGSHFWAFQRAGILPDIVTMGKPAGNGHPLGILACTREVAEAFANGMEFFNTFGGNPVSCAIGMEVLRVIKDEELQANALSTGEFLKHGLREMATDFPIISDVRGSGLFLGVELTDGDLNPMTEKTHYLVNRMRDFGILTSSDGPHENVIKIKPPMVFGREQAETLLQRLRQILTEDYMKID
jgi:4-aminobutyrate aminotransferase-like enzyme